MRVPTAIRLLVGLVRVPPAIRLLVGLVFVSALVAAPASTATAHTDFDYSLPTDGASVPEPVDEITVAFTLPVTLVGNGFEVLDPLGNVLEPFVVTDDDTVFRLQIEPPIAGGEAAVRYEVRAEDGHVLTGGFRFTIDAPVPTTPASTSVAPTTLASSTTGPTATAPETAAPDIATPHTPTADTTSASEPGVTATTPTADVANTTVAAVGDAVPTVAPGDDGGSGTNMLLVGGAGVVALGAAGFLFARSRSSGTPMT